MARVRAAAASTVRSEATGLVARVPSRDSPRDLSMFRPRPTNARRSFGCARKSKVARDVYSALAEKWQLGPHSNIRHAEQRHMDAMLHLVTRYGIEDPVQTDEPGKFQDAELQKIYDSLLERGSRSAQDALRVGCDVEQLDIHDLRRFLETNQKDDIRRVFEAQIRASRNHLRAFNRGLVAQTGSGCEATYLHAGELSEIVQSAHESCGGGPDGPPY